MNSQALPLRLVDPQNRPTAAAVLIPMSLLFGLAVLGAWLALPLFVGAILLLLALLVYAAARWPRAALVGVVLATLSDPYVLRGLIPARMDDLLTGFTEVLITAVGIAIVAWSIRNRSLVPALRDPVTVLATGFVLIGLLSALVNGVSPVVAVLGLIVTLDGLLVYFLVRMLPFDRRSISLAVAVLVGATVAASLVGMAQALLTPEVLWFRAFPGRFGEGPRVTGFLGNPNLLAALIGFTLPFPLFGTLNMPTRRWRWLSAAAVAILVIGLFLTFSRGGWLAVAIGVLVGALVIDWRVLLVLVAAGAVAFALAASAPRDVLLDPNNVPSWFAGDDVLPDIFDSLGRRVGAANAEDDLRVRWVVEGMPILLDHPLLGVGPGRYGGAVATITDSSVYAQYDTGLYGFRTVHNFWLHTLGEVGALGTAIFLTMVVGLLLRIARAARRATGLSRTVLAGVATGTVVVILNNLTEMLFEGNFPSFAIWMLLGFGSILAGGALLERGDAAPVTEPAP